MLIWYIGRERLHLFCLTFLQRETTFVTSACLGDEALQSTHYSGADSFPLEWTPFRREKNETDRVASHESVPI